MVWEYVKSLKQVWGYSMKIRIKFSKHGVIKFVGHLDMMRYFQKAIRRAGIDVTYSGGFSPHQIMSFAAPLGVGYCSNGEYLDIEVNSHEGRDIMMKRLNEAMVPGVEIKNIVALDEDAKNAMASVAAAGYTITWKENYPIPENLQEACKSFYSSENIYVTKQTKKSTLTIDLKPGIYELRADADSLYMLVDASSSGNIKPSLLLEAFYRFLNLEFEPMAVQITREETYTWLGNAEENNFCPLDAVGVIF